MNSYLYHKHWRTVLTCFASLGMLLVPQTAPAAGTVTNCTETELRAAMDGGGTITFDCDGTITLADTLVVSRNTTLDAAGHSITLSGGEMVPVLVVDSGVALTLKRLIVADGHTTSWFGELGGGLLNSGATTIIDCVFSNNIAVAGEPAYGAGGAINHAGTKLEITGSTFVYNGADTTGGAISCGLGSVATGNIMITNCTFSENWSGSASWGGGAIYMDEPLQQPVTVVNCTFASNTNGAVFHVVGSLAEDDHGVRLLNSILADTVGANSAIGIIDGGFNLSTDASASLNSATSLTNTDPMLLPLAHYGGPTPTMALAPGSPALEVGNALGAPSKDQRGVPRPLGLANDAGAFEGSVDLAFPSKVHFALANTSVGEESGSTGVQIERTGISSPIAVGFSATSGTASNGLDFVATNLIVNFADGEMLKTVGLTILPDAVVESDETVLLTLHDPVGTIVDSPSNATLTIVDDDAGGQVLTNLTDTALRTAVGVGGLIQFGMDGTVLLTNTINVLTDTTIEAGGHNVILSGGNTVRLFNVESGTSLTLNGMTLANGRVEGQEGEPEQDGGVAQGGAVQVNGGELGLIDCRVWTNSAVGGTGGPGSPPRGSSMIMGSGGFALGGAIHLEGGVLNATNCEFVGNLAQGGDGGATFTSFPTPPTKVGGGASGGAIFNHNGTVNLDGCLLSSNETIGGAAAAYGDAFATISGEADGGALFNDGGTVVVTNCQFTQNQLTSLLVIGPYDSTGTTNSGGAIYNGAGTMHIVETTFATNEATGGPAADSPSGFGHGGALCNLDAMSIVRCSFIGNRAQDAIHDIYFHYGSEGRGGALMNGGSLHIEQSLFRMNTAFGGQGEAGGAARGGAIYSTNQLTVLSSLFDHNVARVMPRDDWPLGNHPPVYGGGIYTLGSGYLTNVTLAANTVVCEGNGFGGAIYSAGGSMTLSSCTVSGNSGQGAAVAGGGVNSGSGTLSVINTILSGNAPGGNCSGTLFDLGHNLSSDASCNFSAPGSLNNTDPILGPLDDYGGPTPTMPLLTGSPALDAGDSVNSPPTDQRGHTRPFGLAPDIGAFESSPPYVIRGQVTGFTLADEVSVTGPDTTETVNGWFSIEGVDGGTHLVTPVHPDYVFIPANQSLTVGPDLLDVQFRAYHKNALSYEGATNGLVHLIFAGASGETHRVLMSTNLPDWFPISTNTIAPTGYFECDVPGTLPAQFYRTVKP